jgi:hypothetical protein
MRPPRVAWIGGAAVLLALAVLAWAVGRPSIDAPGCWEFTADADAPRGLFHAPPERIAIADDHTVAPAGDSRSRARVDTLFITRWRKDFRGRLVIEHTNTYRGVLMTLSGDGDSLRGDAHTFDDLTDPGARPRSWNVAATRIACE